MKWIRRNYDHDVIMLHRPLFGCFGAVPPFPQCKGSQARDMNRVLGYFQKLCGTGFRRARSAALAVEVR
jgi:hypothetical protein